jgi:hypothetical protein
MTTTPSDPTVQPEEVPAAEPDEDPTEGLPDVESQPGPEGS